VHEQRPNIEDVHPHSNVISTSNPGSLPKEGGKPTRGGFNFQCSSSRQRMLLSMCFSARQLLEELNPGQSNSSAKDDIQKGEAKTTKGPQRL